jgi:hypothetical protein
MTISILQECKIKSGLKTENGNLVILQHENLFNTGQVSYHDNVRKLGDIFEISIHNEIVVVEITGSTFKIIQQPSNLQDFINTDSGQLCQLICECIDFNNIQLNDDASPECKYIFNASEKQKNLCGSYAEIEKWGR